MTVTDRRRSILPLLVVSALGCGPPEVADAVEVRLLELLAEYRPECQLEHWELGCMRTIENGMILGHESGYCCFQVAVWGNDACDGD